MRFSSDDTRLTMASLSLSAGGLVILGIQKLSFTDELSGDPIYGNDSVSVGLPAGQHKAEGSLALLAEVADSLRQSMGPNWMRIPTVASATFFEPLGAGLINYTATRVYLRKIEMDAGKPGGSDPEVETFGLVILDPINWNGAPGVVSSATFGIPGLAISF